MFPRLLTFAAVAACAFALDVSKLNYSGYVNDFAGVIDAAHKAQIEAYCASLEQQTNVQFAVATITSLEDDAIEDVSNKLFTKWGVGKKTTDEGLLFLIAVKDRKQRVELGYGLEPFISDGFTGETLRGVRPILRQGDYGGAILAVLSRFGEKVASAKGISLTGVPVTRSQPANDQIPWTFIIIVGLFLLMSLGSRGGGGFRGGGMGGFLPGLILGNLGAAGRRGRYGGWGGGGFGGYDSGGGGGFGGFGGGSAGGGGASSDW